MNRSYFHESLFETNEGNQCGDTLNEDTDHSVRERDPTGMKLSECPTSGNIFQECTFFQNQQRSQTGYTPHPCEECGEASRCVWCLSTHVEMDLVEKPYECQVIKLASQTV